LPAISAILITAHIELTAPPECAFLEHMQHSSPDVLLLDLILAAIDEGIIETERDLVRLYVWLCAVTRRQTPRVAGVPRQSA